MSQSLEAVPLVIPRSLIVFLEERACVGMACTRDRELRPRIHWLSGWTVAEGGRELVCQVSRGFTDGLLDALGDCGELAVTIEHIGPHETYQFKGRFAGSRAPEPGDRLVWERIRARFSKAVQVVDPQLGAAEDRLREYIPAPELVLRLSVREIFLQTPGPGAGCRLAPPEAR